MCSKTLWRRCKPKIAEDDTGPQATDLFKKMNDECMHYNILQVSGRHKVGMMIETFETIQQDIGAHKALKVYDMQYGINFDTVIKEIVGAIREQLKKTDKGNDQEVSCQEVPLSGTSCVLQSSGCLFSSFILFFLSFEKGKDGKIGVVEHR